MKQILVICDGMADSPVERLNGKTPLQAAETPALDFLAANGRCGSLRTVPEGHYPGSETAILTILGYAPDELPSGRGPLEATGLGIDVSPDDTVMRYAVSEPSLLLNGNADLRHTLEHKFPDLKFHSLSETSGICIIPGGCRLSDIHAEGIAFWSGDTPRAYKPFVSRHPQFSRPVVIGAVPLLKGMAYSIQAEWIRPEGATGDCDTAYRAKCDAAIAALQDHDIVILHIEACDYASHKMDVNSKLNAIRNIDREIIGPLMKKLCDGEDFAIAVMSDHPSLCEKGCHSADSVPFLLYYHGIEKDETNMFSEEEAATGNLESISDIYRQ